MRGALRLRELCEAFNVPRWEAEIQQSLRSAFAEVHIASENQSQRFVKRNLRGVR